MGAAFVYLTDISKNFLAGTSHCNCTFSRSTWICHHCWDSTSLCYLFICNHGSRPITVWWGARNGISITLLLTDIIAKHGMAYMIYATLLAGIFQLIFGFFNIHKLIDHLPKSVMQGFVNVLAIMILMVQLK